MGLLDKLFGTYSDRELKKIAPLVAKIDGLGATFAAMSDEALSGMTARFRERLAAGESLDSLLPEAFAVVREASSRVLGMRHFGVQLVGGVVLHQGRIAEMRTGEGKTLVATLPAYLNALTGEGVHIVTVNDYLAKRDSEWMGKIHRYLGLTVGLVVHGLSNPQRQEAYACDITYGTNNEYGFDYLRDNMALYKQNMVQRSLAFALVDEVDSILVDEARTPLIISGPAEQANDMYNEVNAFVEGMRVHRVQDLDKHVDTEEITADYIVNEEKRTALLTPTGVRKTEQRFGIENLSDPANATIYHHMNLAVRAHGVYRRDVDYIVEKGEVILVDDFTGRLMYGRRYSEGMHQAVEAKEGVEVQRESRTHATITYQNYFKLYKKLSGMTGTAQTEEAEFREIYKRDVVVIPTEKPMIRSDHPDVVYKTERGKLDAVIENIVSCHQKGQPVLVGTISIEKNEHLSRLLHRRGVKHEVLNAKNHAREAEIIAQAGKPGAVTIATNMAGRGTDIILGGNTEYAAKTEMRRQGFSEELIAASTTHSETKDEDILNARRVFLETEARFYHSFSQEAQTVREAGGLFVIGTERHEARRIDNQLRGRAGRQGDPGESRFFIALEDDLMRLFGGSRISSMLETIGLEEDMPIEAGILSNSIESAQRRVEGNNFEVRKSVLQFDDVMNEQRSIIYGQRQQVLNGDNLRDIVTRMITDLIRSKVSLYCDPDSAMAEWDVLALELFFTGQFLNPGELVNAAIPTDAHALAQMLIDKALAVYAKREAALPDIIRELERAILLHEVDRNWMDHIDAMDSFRISARLRSNPVQEYTIEGFQMFEEMTAAIRENTVRTLFTFQVGASEQVERKSAFSENELYLGGVRRPRKGAQRQQGNPAEQRQPQRRQAAKVGRNAPCPCGSGKKYKQCCYDKDRLSG